MTKKLIILMLALVFCLTMPVNAADIIWVSDGYDDNADGASDDLEWKSVLEAAGYSVDYNINAIGDGYWRTLDADKIAALNAAGLVIVSRNLDSGSYDDGDEITQWNSITAPLMNCSTHVIRSSRWKWLNSTTILSLTPVMVLADGTEIPAINADVGLCSFIDSDPGNGVVHATGDGLPWIIEWQAGVEFYDGAGQIAGGRRVFFVAGTQEDAATGVGRGEMNLTPEGVEAFLYVVNELLPVPEPEGPPLADVTAPGDAVKGVPNDSDWPGAETPPLSVDNNVNTKYLHFKGDFDPDPGTGGTGIQITPAAGMTLVTGITLTTANDVPGRDPIAFELSGSNVGIDGPYEKIASGDVVDFAGEAEWPRFTKNTTAIAFDNAVAYKNYQIIFTAIRGPVGDSVNSMQIAEIELLGLKLEAGNLSPANGAVAMGIDADLSWSAGSLAVSHDVYFGTEVPPALVGNQEGTSYDPGTLEYGTTYYWQIDEVEADGTVRPGALLSFKTTTPVGIFEYTRDIGDDPGIGRTTYEGYVWKDDKLSEQYLLMGGGHDVWDNADDFHYAYNTVSGDVRVSANFEWIVKSNDWAKYGVMLRNSTDAGSTHRYMAERGLSDYAGMQGRVSANGGSSEFGTAWTTGAKALGIQKVTVQGLTFIEGLADFGNGWESRAIDLILSGFDDEILAGVAITSHDSTHLVQARCWNVSYKLNPGLVGELAFPMVPASADLGAPTSDVPGFKIETLKPLVTDGWGYAAVREIFDTGMYKGLPPQPGTKGSRISQFVNIRDTGNGVFSVDNGYPDESFPGIDPDEIPAADPAAGDDDDNYGAQVTACIHLAPGLHMIGANSDDGTIIEIGGVEIGRATEWKGTSNADFVFQVEAEGYYNLRALYIEGGGGSSIELHEVLMDGTRILLNDVANGGSAVYAPAP